MSEEYDYAIAKSDDAALDFTETDTAIMDSLNITISKESTIGESGNLEGAVFEIDYYDGYYDSLDKLPQRVTKRWFIETKYNIREDIYKALFTSSYLASDPEFAGFSSKFEYGPKGEV